MTIQDIQNEIVEEFEVFDDWLDRYQYIIDLSKDLPIIDDEFKTEQYLIKGCQSQVWLQASFSNGLIHFKADSDGILTKGIAALLVKVLSERTPQEIIDCELFFIEEIGLKENLSPTRSNGLLAMIKQMRLYAIAFNHKS